MSSGDGPGRNGSSLPAWKEELYRRYRSTGQASAGLDAEGWKQRVPWAEHIAHRYLPEDRDARILDLGCGDGLLLAWLERVGYRRLEGVEISEEQVEAARAACGAEIHHRDVGSHLADREPASVDVVVAIDLLEHFPRVELLELLDAIHRVLRPRGRLVAKVPNGEGIFGPGVRYADLTHELAFTNQSARQALRAAGFSEVRCEEVAVPGSGLVKTLRRAVWRLATIPVRLLYKVERGRYGVLLSRTFLVSGSK